MPVFISSLERDRLGTATSHDGFHEKLTQQGRRKELRKKKKVHNGAILYALSLFSHALGFYNHVFTKKMTEYEIKQGLEIHGL